MDPLSKEPVCQKCIDTHSYKRDDTSGVSNSSSSTSMSSTAPMQVQTIIGNSWRMCEVEIFHCNNCNYEYTFPRYGEILKIAETRTGRCSAWSMLFGAMLSSLGIKARIVHDFLDHCCNEAMLPPDGQWVHIDSTLDYPISLNHPYSLVSKIYDELRNGKTILEISRNGSGKDTRYFVKPVR
jgi:transglutaminase/protease-like cytokinesis protein 3